jgi:ferric-dicitrate binding protein FerR (iron transport regulator)
MEPTSTHYIDLISRYLFGEGSPGDILELETWVNASPENAALFSEYHKTWKTVENSKIQSSINLDLEFNNLKSEIQTPKSEIRNPKSEIYSWWLRIAATFILLAVPTFFLYRYLALPAEKQLTATAGMVEQTLPDGTVVTLNTGATLSYPTHFEGSFRKVTLQGEAWFEVAHDETKPFIIAAGNVRIRVVGTSFFVNTKTGSDTREVILSSGTVRVYYNDKPEMSRLLLPGDKAELITGGYEITKSANADVNFLAWKTKHLVFSNTPLNEVAALLTKVYQTNIRLAGGNLNDCRITATFDRQSLESVLNVLKATLDLQVRNSGTGIEISGHGCNQGQ